MHVKMAMKSKKLGNL